MSSEAKKTGLAFIINITLWLGICIVAGRTVEMIASWF